MCRAGIEARHAARMYSSLGTAVFEFLWLAGRGPTAIEDVSQIDPASLERLQATRALGRGLVIAATHTGNWDLAACAFSRLAPLLVVTKRLSLRSLDTFWHQVRARFGVQLTTAEGALLRGRVALQEGGAVAMMIDQVPQRGRHGVRGEFLGASAWLDKAPAALAARSGAPLVVAAACRSPDGHHVLYALEVFVPPAHAGLDWIESTTHAATQALEAFVRSHPESWLWMHRRWKDVSLPS